MKIVEIAASITGDRTTVRRAVLALEQMGLVDRDPSETRYRLGFYLFSLAAKTARRFDALIHARDAVRRLAEITGDTVALVIRNKYDAVCIDVCSGSYPIKAQKLGIGESLPLGVSSAGLALLATMTDEDVRHVIQHNTVRINSFRRVKAQDLYAHVRETRRRGFALYRGHVIAGVGTLGFTIGRRNSMGALTLSAVAERLSDERVKSLAETFKKEIEEIERKSAIIFSASHLPAERVASRVF